MTKHDQLTDGFKRTSRRRRDSQRALMHAGSDRPKRNDLLPGLK